ncbi:MAG: M15 family metallopeptidase [Oscillospiraceae bacterium]|nr:M15 family metallopeptidase [Oscillospiraceae bacterium]
MIKLKKRLLLPIIFALAGLAVALPGAVATDDPDPPPAMVENLEAFLSPGGIALTWDTVSGADGYEVFRSRSLSGDFELLEPELMGAEYTDSAIEYGIRYFYKVRAYRLEANIVPEEPHDLPSDIFVRVYGDESEPADAVFTLGNTKITSIVTAKHRALTVTWDPVDNVHFYEVTRSDTQNGTYKKISTVQGTSFINEKLTTSVYYFYRVIPCVEFQGKIGRGGTNTLRGRALLEEIDISSIKAVKPKILEIKWKRNKYADGYRVYRSTKAKGPFKRISTIKNNKTTSFKAKKQKHGKLYYYIVRAYKTVNSTRVLGLSAHPRDAWMDYYGHRNETLARKQRRVFKSTKNTWYSTRSSSWRNMKRITVKVWSIDKKGRKYTRRVGVTVHKKLAKTVSKIFLEIYNGKEKFPMHTVWGYNWRTTSTGGRSEHSIGTAIDINPRENYMIRNGKIVAGSFWRPTKNRYSIKRNGDVVRAFRKYGFVWGGDWVTAKDYMHFSYFGR